MIDCIVSKTCLGWINESWNILLQLRFALSYNDYICYFVGVQIEEDCKKQDRHGLSPEMRQLSAVGAVKVAVRSSSMGVGPAGSSKS